MAKFVKFYANVPIKTEADLRRFINYNRIAERVRFFVSLFAPDGSKLEKLTLTMDGKSFTDMVSITIGLSKNDVGLTPNQICMRIKWRGIHEMSHKRSTPDDKYRAAIKKLVKYFKAKYNFSESILYEVAKFILNGLEDGRIEARFFDDFPQEEYKNYFRYDRGRWYIENACVMDEKAPYNELFDSLFCLCTLATVGKLQMGWVEKWSHKKELIKMMNEVRPYVNAFVASKTFDEADTPLWAIVNHLEDWMVNLMKQIPEPKLSDGFKIIVNSCGGDATMNNPSGYGANPNPQQIPQSGGNSESGSQSANNNQNGSQNGNSDSNNQNGNQECDNSEGNVDSSDNGENPLNQNHEAFCSGGPKPKTESDNDGDFGLNMKKIITDAMREAEDAIGDINESIIVQANFDDLRDKAAVEKKLEEDVKERIETFYKNLDSKKRGGSKWNVPLVYKTYNLPEISADTHVLRVGRYLNGEFKKLLLNRQAFTSRNRRRGVLDTTSLYRLSMNETNVFMKKGTPHNTSFVFYILIDGSGSMHGNKFKNALEAAAILEEALRGIAPVKIVVFEYNSPGNKVIHHIVKTFKENHGNASWAYANYQRTGSCNMDGYSIRVATEELQHRSETQKVLITLSDGMPAGPSGYNSERGANDVSEAVLEARKNGIHVFNIFFAETQADREQNLPVFKTMYRNQGIIACEPSKIGSELLRVVQRELA